MFRKEVPFVAPCFSRRLKVPTKARHYVPTAFDAQRFDSDFSFLRHALSSAP